MNLFGCPKKHQGSIVVNQVAGVTYGGLSPLLVTVARFIGIPYKKYDSPGWWLILARGTQYIPGTCECPLLLEFQPFRIRSELQSKTGVIRVTCFQVYVSTRWFSRRDQPWYHTWRSPTTFETVTYPSQKGCIIQCIYKYIYICIQNMSIYGICMYMYKCIVYLYVILNHIQYIKIS